MKITFDRAKRDRCLYARGLDMARCDEVFSGPTLTVEDTRKDYGEDRHISVGYLDQRMVVLVWTPRADSIRIISMRKANAREQEKFKNRLD